MTIQFMAMVLLGKLIIFLIQVLTGNIKIKLLRCDLCLGVWVYAGLSGLFQTRLLEDVYWYVPVVSEIITGCVVSYLVHLLSIGFREKHLPVIL